MLCYSVCNPTVNKHGKNQKSNERGYPMIERIEYQYILYNTKKTQVIIISPTTHSDQNPLLKTMLPHRPPAVPATAPAYAR